MLAVVVQVLMPQLYLQQAVQVVVVMEIHLMLVMEATELPILAVAVAEQVILQALVLAAQAVLVLL
jgi:hypothetical protein